MVLLGGGDDSVKAILLDRETSAKDVSASWSRPTDQVKLDGFSAIPSAAKMKIRFDEGNKIRRQAASDLLRTQPRSQSG